MPPVSQRATSGQGQRAPGKAVRIATPTSTATINGSGPVSGDSSAGSNAFGAERTWIGIARRDALGVAKAPFERLVSRSVHRCVG
ncbi:hypothetical protein C3941_08175 [Kaistia algarum]|nr:hypothetical protein C3941_08175 [Kaistia algarum]